MGTRRRATPRAMRRQSDVFFGERESGQDVRQSNATAVQAVANIVKSSLGPVGLDKMLVDDIGDVTITNDGATILKLLEIEHPAAKILVELAELQDQEVGDGTTSVVILAAELLKRANELVKNKIHPTSVISGYRLAMREACKYVEEHLAIPVATLGKDTIRNAAMTSMSSKIIGADAPFFADLVCRACEMVKVTDIMGIKTVYPIKSISILKAHYGLDLVEGVVRNNVEAGVLEPAMAKVKVLQFATEAAITILRIDDLIRLEAKEEQ